MTLPAAPVAAWASAAPVRAPGTRTRSGNAMHRTRAALLDAAEHCIARYGARHTTMGDVALKAAVAKGTLYNHFRTKEDLLAGLVQARVDDVAQACLGRAGEGAAVVLAAAAEAVCRNEALRRVVTEEPALAARLAAAEGPGRGRALDAVRRVLEAATGRPVGEASAQLTLQWLTSLLLRPADGDSAGAQARLLAAAVGSAAATGAGADDATGVAVTAGTSEPAVEAALG